LGKRNLDRINFDCEPDRKRPGQNLPVESSRANSTPQSLTTSSVRLTLNKLPQVEVSLSSTRANRNLKMTEFKLHRYLDVAKAVIGMASPFESRYLISFCTFPTFLCPNLGYGIPNIHPATASRSLTRFTPAKFLIPPQVLCTERSVQCRSGASLDTRSYLRSNTQTTT
jgi:hypothetical protein